MATKNEMHIAMNDFFLKYQTLFEWVGIKRLTFFKWLDSLEDWETCRRANSFIFTKLYKKITDMHKVFLIMPESAWTTMFVVGKTSREVLLLKEHIFNVKECWQNRIKPRRGPE